MQANISSRVKEGYSLRISSIESPAPKNSSTVCTVIRVPRITGRPLQTSGLIAIRSPISCKEHAFKGHIVQGHVTFKVTAGVCRSGVKTVKPAKKAQKKCNKERPWAGFRSRSSAASNTRRNPLLDDSKELRPMHGIWVGWDSNPQPTP